ncbi:MAG: tetratricopeptide (TPR) repeat protein [Paracoccaceae bacterium]|jgi:tetratricopeptide (TPR) repeat protein
MKKFLLSLFALSLMASAQESSAPANAAEAKPAKPQFIIELEALTKEQSLKYFTYYQEADKLFKQKRIFECLDEIHKLHEIYDKNPASLNLKGACYVEFRNFDKARMAFAKALEENTDNFNVRFNLAEIEFVTQNYGKALEKLTELAKEAEDTPSFASMEPLLKFKMLLCMLKLDNEAGAKKVLEGSDFLDDSPLFYYGNAALEYFADRGAKAEIWLARAGRIFRSPSAIAPWQDTLIEFGYIKSFYGGDLEVEGK